MWLFHCCLYVNPSTCDLEHLVGEQCSWQPHTQLLEHLECSHQPHIQGRGAEKRTQRAG